MMLSKVKKASTEVVMFTRKQWSVVSSSTFAFTICFAIWMMFAVIGIPIKAKLGLNETEFGLLTAMPVLSGSLIRLPLGMLTDKLGGRIVFFILMLACVVPIWFIGDATEYWQFLVLGLFVGLAGGSFSVGIAYVARWFDKKHQGTAMGIFGAGNSGAAVTKFVAPSIVLAFGWAMVPKVYAVAMLVTALVFWMSRYYVSEYGFDLKTAALLAACFSLPGGVLRAVGGWLSDKYGAHSVTWWVLWVSWICLFIMSYPQTDFTIQTVNGPETFHIGLSPTVFTVLLSIIGVAWAFGKASVFKYISDDYPHNIGVISGIVGLIGGLGGFILPIMFGALVDLTGIRSSSFMLLYGVVWVSLIWMYLTEVRASSVLDHKTTKQAKN